MSLRSAELSPHGRKSEFNPDLKLARRCAASSPLTGSGLTSEVLSEATAEIEGWQELRVLRNILRRLDPSIAFGLMAGQRCHLTTLGMWGLVAVCSRDIRSAVHSGLRYSDLTYSFNRFGFEVRERQAHFLYYEDDNPSPSTAHLDIRQPMADEVGLRICEDACRAQLERQTLQQGVAGQVLRRLSAHPGEIPSMDAVAASLRMNVRTLRNRLSKESTSFRALVEELRTRMAEDLLESRVPVDQIAHGYRVRLTDRQGV